MFYNGANCDIYIGKGAGKKLKDDMYNAKSSVKIISPYLSPYLIKELINLKHRGIEVQLVTVDEIEEYRNSREKNIYELIRQHRQTDETAQTKRNKWKKSMTILLVSLIIASISLIGAFYYLRNNDLLLGIAPVLILLFAYLFCRSKYNNKRIYHYSYSQLFPFKVFMSPDKHPHSDTFIHGKIYIIDDAIVYMGSLNLTISGTKHNYETRIRTTDYEAIKKVKDEFYDLFYNSSIPEVNIQSWGSYLYQEPIN